MKAYCPDESLFDDAIGKAKESLRKSRSNYSSTLSKNNNLKKLKIETIFILLIQIERVYIKCYANLMFSYVFTFVLNKVE